MFASFHAHVFAATVSEAKTLMSALRYARLIHSYYSISQFQPSPLCASGANRCLLCPPEYTTLTMTLSSPSTCMLVLTLQSKRPKAKQSLL